MGKAIKAVTTPVANVLFGQKQVQEADPIAGQLFSTGAAASKAQETALGQLNTLGTQNYNDLANAQIESNVKALEGSREDNRRNVEALVRQRGLGNTSAGLSALTGADRDIAEKIAMQRASMPTLADQLRRGRAQEVLNAANSIVSSQNLPVNLRRQEGRAGGLSGILGAALGGEAGGVGGAKIGYGVGQGLGGMFG